MYVKNVYLPAVLVNSVFVCFGRNTENCYEPTNYYQVLYVGNIMFKYFPVNVGMFGCVRTTESFYEPF